jgi:8-oxo-dGTP diphosphatase
MNILAASREVFCHSRVRGSLMFWIPAFAGMTTSRCIGIGVLNPKENKMTEVAVGILRKNEKILICQRKKGGRYELKWEFPGGKLEPGETTEQCLRRELREELSIEVQTIERIEVQSAFYEDGGMFHVSYCFISGFTGEPQNHVFEQICWVTFQELNSMDLLDGNKSFIAKLAP